MILPGLKNQDKWSQYVRMKNSFSLFLLLCIVLSIFFIYSPWFLHKEIIGGDWPYLFTENIKDLSLTTSIWNPIQGNGLGGQSPSPFIDQYLVLTAYISYFFYIPWQIVYKIFWFGLFIFVSFFSSIYLYRTIFNKIIIWEYGLAGLLYSANTYILMVVGGGQMGVTLAYAIAPFVLARYIILWNKKNYAIKALLIAGLTMGLQVMLDPRIAYISLFIYFIYFLFILWGTKSLPEKKRKIFYAFYYFFVMGGVICLLNAFWILPMLITKNTPINNFGTLYTSVGAFKFFSFASFSQTISLLHPNWPENIFGKVSFMRSEFLVIGIITYSSLFFAKKEKIILFFSIIGLIGAFLAKGANEPFGVINIWMFTHIPGFFLFRDPTKFYTLIALSYSMLIPFTIASLFVWIKEKKVHFLIPYFFIFICALYILSLLYPAFSGKLGGTFQENKIPEEYLKLKDILNNDHTFSRTLWIPRQQRFAFASRTHPAIEAGPLFRVTKSVEIVKKLDQEFLSKLAIKYVVVPYDSFGEIFVSDRKYNEKEYKQVLLAIENTPWLKKIDSFKDIGVFQLKTSVSDHFRINDNKNVPYDISDIDEYKVYISTDKATTLVFVENYNSYWMASLGDTTIPSLRTKDGLNSFVIPKGEHEVKIYFGKSSFYLYGIIISWGTLTILLVYLLTISIKMKKNKNRCSSIKK